MIEDMINKKVREMPPSGIRKFFDIVSEMKDAISLGVGEPDFNTPWHIREEAIYSLEKGKTNYTSNSGLLELRKEICKYLYRKFDLSYDYKEQVLVTVGGSEGIDLALRAILEPGDEVIIPEPCFVSYRPCVVFAGGVPVTINLRAENQFRLTKEELLGAITDKTKAILLSFPNNPTGAIMERKDLEEIADVLRERDIIVISDEIYAELSYDKKHVSIASIAGMYDKTIIVSGFSKAYSMTGWRMGYAVGNKAIIKAMTKIHQFAIMCSPTTSQYAAIEAVKNGDDDVENMKKEYNRRRRLMLKGFRDMGLDVFEPLGAFYIFPCIKSLDMTSQEFCEKLLYSKKVAAVPGTAFGECGEGFIRCSYANSIDQLKIAIELMKEFVEEQKEKE